MLLEGVLRLTAQFIVGESRAGGIHGLEQWEI